MSCVVGMRGGGEDTMDGNDPDEASRCTTAGGRLAAWLPHLSL